MNARAGERAQRSGGHWPGQLPRRNSPWRRWSLRLLVLGVFVAFVIGAFYLVNRGVDWYRAQTVTTTGPTAEGPALVVTVTPGMSASQIGKVLEEQGVIESSTEFVDLVKSRGSADSLKPGIYRFYQGQKLAEIIEWLEQGKGSASFKVTIPEGLAASQIGDLLDDQGRIKGDIYVRLCGQPEEFVLPRVGGDKVEVSTLEGLLFPSTYYLLEGEGAVELIGAQLKAFESKTASLPWDKAEGLGITPYQAVIVASLIEKEVSVPEERALVAAVVYNRLKADMTLGIDATVRYALGKWTGALTDADLAVESPYNTRVTKGLPPTPIANPGLAALEAALAPAKVDYLYYVLKDKEGNHFFTSSYEEFLEAKRNQPQ